MNKKDFKHIPYAARQTNKGDLVRIARALGLKASKKETSRALVERCVDAASRLRRDFDLAVSRPR